MNGRVGGLSCVSEGLRVGVGHGSQLVLVGLGLLQAQSPRFGFRTRVGHFLGECLCAI